MKKNEFLRELEEVIEADPESITGDESLTELAGWDSLAVMTFIAMVNERFDITLSASKLAQAKNVDDLVALLGDHVSG